MLLLLRFMLILLFASFANTLHALELKDVDGSYTGKICDQHPTVAFLNNGVVDGVYENAKHNKLYSLKGSASVDGEYLIINGRYETNGGEWINTSFGMSKIGNELRGVFYPGCSIRLWLDGEMTARNSSCTPQDRSRCSDKVICVFAVRADASIATDQPLVIEQAKKRNLTCRAANGKQVKFANPSSKLKTYFNKLTVGQRKAIQTKLANEGFYSAKIDGLYGSKTAASLKAYNKQNFNAASLKREKNIEALMEDLLAVVIEPVAQEVSNKETEVEPQIIDQTLSNSMAPIDPLAAFNTGDYQTALLGAKLLVPDADKDALYVLGAMYAKGLGVLQHYKTAHMWLNIAALNGSAQAVSLRDEVQTNMSMTDVTAAQDLAMKCIQSAYSDCAGSDYRKTKSSAKTQAADTEKESISQAFKNQSTLRRKQLQYALKELGLYSSSVDGIWGKGTARAFENYANLSDMTSADATQVFENILSKVDVPSAFQTTKTVRQKTTTKSASKPAPEKKQYVAEMGYRPYGNTTMSVRQALDVCKNEGSKAFDSASNGAKFKSNRYSGRCSGSSYSYNCNVQQDSPYGNNLGNAAAIGIMEGIARGLAGRAARDAEMKACMAHYGWKKIK